jgi:hypothetical protein
MLRAQILGDGETADHALNEQLSATGEADALTWLLWAAFALTVRRYFAAQEPTWHRGQVVQYVAHVRALLSEKPEIIDAPTAEDEICVALGGQPAGTRDPMKTVLARYLMLNALAAELDLTEDDVDTLLAEARQATDQHLAQVAP